MILGIEVRDGAVAVVAAGEGGAITARSLQNGASAASAAAAVRAVAGGPARLGIAVRDPIDAGVAALVEAAARAAGAQDPPRVVTRGTAVALAEQWCGAARGANHVVTLTSSDCVHAGIVVHGRPFEGAHGLAGAAGWLALNPVEREDYRKIGCLEAEIGAAGIVRRLVWRLKSGDRSRALDLAGGDMTAITVTHVFDAARGGDGVAISVVRDTARYIGMAIGNLVAVVDPDIVLLGGVIAEAADLLVEPARVEAARRMPASAAGSVTIAAADLGADAGALGAARAAML
ncbi:MAG: ROK family protein [Acidobacteria bacterium]|nr:ROK family protein [Acidobacteriota bacterium]